MEQKRLNEIINNFLINANQLAYIEEAAKTYELLGNFNELFRYIVNNETTNPLFNELEVLKKYIYVQKVPYGSRFDVSFNNEDKNKAVYIKHMEVINFFDWVFHQILEKYEDFIYINLNFETENLINMIISVDSNNQREVFTKSL